MTYEKRDSWGRTQADRERDQAERRMNRLDDEACRVLERVSKKKNPTAWDIRECEVAQERAQAAFEAWLALASHKRTFTA